nr:MAG TPA: NTP-PPase-like protein [Caudoviricetes sp.]
MSFGKAIKVARKAKGMSQLELALELGTSQMSVCNWETEKARPNVTYTKIIKDVLGVDVMGDSLFNTLKPLVEQWFVDRGLDKRDGSGQLEKLQEEVDELKQAYIEVNRDEEIDAVGDILVVLIGYCLQRGLDIEECLSVAYNVIKNRTGQVVNGVFVKDV